MGAPAAEIDIDAGLVRELLRAQHPDLADLPLVALSPGWDNAIFRLGETLALRLPRRALAARLVEHEQRWLPVLAPRLPLAVPVPVRIGIAQGRYPWAWSVTPWIDGHTADIELPNPSQGEVLANFFEALHVPAPADAPHNPYRGVPLEQRRATFEQRVARLAGRTDLVSASVLDAWGDALAAAPETNPTWIHGDPHPRNVLVVDGRLSGVIDWGDVARGDRAADLAAVWMLIGSREGRERAIAACRSASTDAWRRARGWAALYAVIFLDAGLTDDPAMAAIGALTLERLREGP